MSSDPMSRWQFYAAMAAILVAFLLGVAGIAYWLHCAITALTPGVSQ